MTAATTLFSPSTGAFYPADIAYPAGAIPADAIPVSDTDMQAAHARAADETFAFVNGALVISGPTLAQVQAAHIGQLNNAYQTAITAPVSYTTAAGVPATFAQDAQAKAYLQDAIVAGQKAQAWPLNLWMNTAGSPISPFTYADLQGLAAAMEAAEVPAYQDLLTKIAAVQAATSVAAVQAISF